MQNLTIREEGEPNFYMLLDTPAHWLARVQINGELLPEKQREFMRLFAAAPELLAALEAILEPFSAAPDTRSIELHKTDDQYFAALAAIAKAKGV